MYVTSNRVYSFINSGKPCCNFCALKWSFPDILSGEMEGKMGERRSMEFVWNLLCDDEVWQCLCRINFAGISNKFELDGHAGYMQLAYRHTTLQ
jgi:hypothetical protein